MRVPALTVRHASGTCPIYIGSGLLADLPELTARHLPGCRLAVIADDTVAALVRSPLVAPVLSFPAGEASKTRDTWSQLTDRLLALGLGRDSAIVALGGGITGDIAGFVAATYLRGIPVLQAPTSLLAMLDASLGGKTGVDTPAGKNLVGAFHQPAAVVIDPDVLGTLPSAEWRNGLGEAVKHALIADRSHFDWLSASLEAIIAGDTRTLETLLLRSIAIKAAIVERDEQERGERAVLNAGHTIAHAIETATHYALGHGEAVAIGLVAEATLGERIGLTEAGTAGRLAELLARCGLPTRVPASAPTSMVLDLMRRDKKNRPGELRFSLPRTIGTMAGSEASGWTQPVAEPAVRAALDACR